MPWFLVCFWYFIWQLQDPGHNHLNSWHTLASCLIFLGSLWGRYLNSQHILAYFFNLPKTPRRWISVIPIIGGPLQCWERYRMSYTQRGTECHMSWKEAMWGNAGILLTWSPCRQKSWLLASGLNCRCICPKHMGWHSKEIWRQRTDMCSDISVILQFSFLWQA